MFYNVVADVVVAVVVVVVIDIVERTPMRCLFTCFRSRRDENFATKRMLCVCYRIHHDSTNTM